MSIDSILRLFKDFENLKYLYLNEKELELFEYMKSANCKEHLEKIKKMHQYKSGHEEIDNFSEINQKGIINRKLAKKIFDDK